MMIRWHRFNIILLAALALLVTSGCKSGPEKDRKKLLSTLHLHQELKSDRSGRGTKVTVFKEPLIQMTVDQVPFLTEANIKSASVVDTIGGFALTIQFDRQGSWLLEQYSAAARGQHIAIFSQFTTLPEKKLNKGQWLTALKVENRITDGMLVFTPDLTRKDAELLADGLNNVAKKLGTNSPDNL